MVGKELEPPTWVDTLKRAGISMTPKLGGGAVVIWEDVQSRRLAAAGETIEAIIKALGTPEALGEALAKDPVVEALFVNAVDAAVRTGIEAKRKLLVRAVVDAITDEAMLDVSLVIEDVLRQLDVPHIQALRRMAVEWAEAQEAVAGTPSMGESKVWRETHSAVRAVLVRTGTAMPPTTTFFAKADPNRQEGISDFGLQLVAELEREGLDLKIT